MDDVSVYIVIGTLMFFIGIILGYLLLDRFYATRFVIVARECEKVDSIVPLIAEMERES
ncbi:MAG TPA: hypothetical protein VMW63_02615 [Methanoregulaceae archaeon]|nr:hypothetical protein [Methanoregulaceae archaeon]